MEPAPDAQRAFAASPGRLGTLLRWHRTRLHLSQEALAEAMGVSSKSIKRWEQNQALPQPYHREQLCRLLGLDPALFLEVLKAERPQPLAARPLFWYVPFPRNPFFTGRAELLQQMRTLLTTTHVAVLTQAYALSGLGGIGKTQVALEYTYRHAQDYAAIFWLGAETEEALLTDVAAIAALLDLPERAEADQNRLLAALTRWLTHQRDWLLILDNLEEEALGKRLLPATQNGAVLLTTRRQALGSLGHLIEVKQLPVEEGAQLVLGRAGRLGPSQEPVKEEEQALACRLTEALDGLPLALDQAGAYLQETGCSLTTYLQLYQTAPLRLLGERSAEEPHPDSVVRTFGLAYERLAERSMGAAALVQVAAYLAPEAIPEELLAQGAAQVGPEIERLVADPFQYQGTFKEVLAYSLLRRQARAGTVTMHRLVQAVIREHLEESIQRVWAERVVRLVAAAFPDSKDYATWEQCQRLLPHALVCASHIERWGFRFPEGAHLLNHIGEYLRQRGQYGAALSLVQQGLMIREQTLGLAHPDVAQSLNNLASLYWRQGRYREALPLYQRALMIREQTLGLAHPDVARSLNNLALLYWRQGHYREALPLYQRALVIWEQTLGLDHPDATKTLNNLALLYREQGQYSEALLLHRRALAIREQALGPDHPDVAQSLNNLADLYHAQGKPVEALPLYQRALTIWEHTLGPEHPYVAQNLNNLAELYQAQGQYAEALLVGQRALAIREQALGPNHPDVAESLSALADLSREQGLVEQAKPLYQRALAIREQALGPNHPDVAIVLNHLAALYQARGQYAEALPLYERAVKINEQALPDHPNTATYLLHLAALLRQMGQADQADAQAARIQAICAREGDAQQQT